MLKRRLSGVNINNAVGEDLGRGGVRRRMWSGAVYAPIMFMSALTTLPYYTIVNMYINERLEEDRGVDRKNMSYQVGLV